MLLNSSEQQKWTFIFHNEHMPCGAQVSAHLWFWKHILYNKKKISSFTGFFCVSCAYNYLSSFMGFLCFLCCPFRSHLFMHAFFSCFVRSKKQGKMSGKNETEKNGLCPSYGTPRHSKCHQQHQQRWCKVFRTWVNLLLLLYSVML